MTKYYVSGVYNGIEVASEITANNEWMAALAFQKLIYDKFRDQIPLQINHVEVYQ